MKKLPAEMWDKMQYLFRNYYFADPLKKHNNSIESVKETEKQSKEAAPLSDFQSSYKGDNSPPNRG